MSNSAKFDALKIKAMSLGAEGFGKSTTRGKRFYVIYDNKKINFGSDVGRTFIDHGDERKKAAWIKRHAKILNKNGIRVMGLKSSASYWSRHLLWD